MEKIMAEFKCPKCKIGISNSKTYCPNCNSALVECESIEVVFDGAKKVGEDRLNKLLNNGFAIVSKSETTNSFDEIEYPSIEYKLERQT